MKARAEKLDSLREIKKVKDEERYRVETTPSILQSPSKSNLRYSQVESRLPAEARISTGRSLSRERGISRDSLNVSRGIKASRGYGDIYQLKKEYESTKI